MAETTTTVLYRNTNIFFWKVCTPRMCIERNLDLKMSGVRTQSLVVEIIGKRLIFNQELEGFVVLLSYIHVILPFLESTVCIYFFKEILYPTIVTSILPSTGWALLFGPSSPLFFSFISSCCCCWTRRAFHERSLFKADVYARADEVTMSVSEPNPENLRLLKIPD